MEWTDRSAWLNALVAASLAAALTAAWAWRDWANLSALRLPDADDMMRLQQIRDWLGGQPFADLTQYRLGAVGVAMHWSRLADLVPAAIIRLLEGAVGRHVAEIAAVIAWPAILLAAAIALTGRIARAVGPADIARPAMIVAGFAYPASTLFLPGRIDHHNLQIVLVLVAALMLVRPGSLLTGLIAGTAASLSIVVGMETAPLLGIIGLLIMIDWVMDGHRARDRMMGFGIALCATTLAASVVFRTTAWGYSACDGFTAISARALMVASFAPIGLALAGWGSSARVRVALGGSSALALGATLAISTPQCFSPYGGVDPVLQSLWLTRVGEAQPLFAAPLAVEIGYAGLMLAGIAAGAWQAWRTRSRGWTTILVLQLAALAVAVTQVRGAYAGAIFAAPALAALIVAARRAGAVPLAGAWVVSAGMLYPLAAQAMATAAPAVGGASCTAPDLIDALRALPAGRVMAPIDTGGVAIASTRQRMIAAAYHRNGAGDLAMYAFYRGRATAARGVARDWRVDYVVACDGFAGVAAPFARQLDAGRAPVWLREVAHVTSGGRIFAVSAGR
ncbi:MAG: hypothetical protein JSR79_07820 [Proteobacteria bacterium]|nr:hypothetical protein [Pseudomonadota bacterium]